MILNARGRFHFDEMPAMILTALDIPSMNYDDMIVADGQAAGLAWESLVTLDHRGYRHSLT
jgi:membrane-bound metal-dependent hydrolase YbcI (DUF457 family)